MIERWDDIPPNAGEAEQAVLGSALIRTVAAEEVAASLERVDFYHEGHRKIFDVICDLQRKDRPVDMLTVPEELRRRGQLEEVGGVAYISVLENSVPTAAHVEFYIRIVQEAAERRAYVTAAQTIDGLARDHGREWAESKQEAEQVLFRVERQKARQRWHSLSEMADRALDLFFGAQPQRGAPIGYGRLDWLLGGWKRQKFSVLAGRPGIGKTAAMLAFAWMLAKAKVPVGIFSTEMDRDQLMARLIAMEARVDSQLLELHELDGDDEYRAKQANHRLSELPLYVNDISDITLRGLRSEARRLKRQRDVQVIMVDYLQRILPDGRGEMDVRHFTAVAEGHKSMARECDVHVMGLSQLSRDVEKRDPPTPRMSDLRESGGIEQAADIVMLLYREAYYARQKGEERRGPDPTDFHVAKHRGGKVGLASLLFYPEFQLFEDPRRAYGDEDAPPDERRFA